MENFKAYPLFNDVEDKALQARNRAIILANISEDHKTHEKKISVKGAILIMGYFQKIPQEERKEVSSLYAQEMNKRGFAIVQ